MSKYEWGCELLGDGIGGWDYTAWDGLKSSDLRGYVLEDGAPETLWHVVDSATGWSDDGVADSVASAKAAVEAVVASRL